MPYYVYKIFPMQILEKAQQFDTFKEASVHAKAMRKETKPTDNYSVKVMFADNELLAEDILSQVREPQPLTGEDY